jgi:hypothetical protein
MEMDKMSKSRSMSFRPLTEEDRQQLPPRDQWELVGEYHSVFVSVTFFENEYARVCKEAMIPLRDLRDLILETTAPTKARLPWLKLARFGDARTERGSLRHDANVVEVYGIEVDYDSEAIPFDTALVRVKSLGLQALVYTSPSHTEAKPRWRIICPTSAPLPPSDREGLVRKLDAALGGVLANESYTLSQAYYFGKVGDNPAHRCELNVGACIDEVELAPQEGTEEAAERPRARETKQKRAEEAKQRINIEERLRDMRYKGEGDASVHNTQRSVSAAMLERQFSIDEVVVRLLEATKAAAGRAGEGWDWEEEERDIRAMCETWLEKSACEELNRDNCVVLDGARTVVLRFERVTHASKGRTYSRMVATFLRPYDFKMLYSNKRVVIGKRSIELGEWWLKHPRRKQYAGVTFVPCGAEVVDGKLNLWRGWGVEPKAGDWGWMRKHMFEVLAAGDDAVDAYVMRWLAWTVQNPAERAEVALVFRGKKGTGKGTLGNALMRIFGQHAHHISSADHLAGRFNAHMRDCCYLFADEAYWPGNKGAEGALKRLITEPTLFVEAKYRDGVTIPNMLHVIMASNEDWVVPAGEGERRYAVVDVAEIHCQDTKWFRQLYDELEEGGYAAMLHDLLAHNLGSWHPRDGIPRNDALVRQQAESLTPLDAWWIELIEDGTLPGASEDEPHRTISNEYEEEVEHGTADSFGNKRTRVVRRRGLYDQARHSSPKLRHATDTALGLYLRAQGCDNVRKVRRRRGWTFPSLAKCCAAWVKRFPGWRWRNPDLEGWTADGSDENVEHEHVEHDERDDELPF